MQAKFTSPAQIFSANQLARTYPRMVTPSALIFAKTACTMKAASANCALELGAPPLHVLQLLSSGINIEYAVPEKPPQSLIAGGAHIQCRHALLQLLQSLWPKHDPAGRTLSKT